MWPNGQSVGLKIRRSGVRFLVVAMCRRLEVLGKLLIPHFLGPPSRNGYLVHRARVGSIVAGCCVRTAKGGKV